MEEENDLPGIGGNTIDFTLDERWRINPIIIDVANMPTPSTEGYLQMIRESGIMPISTTSDYPHIYYPASDTYEHYGVVRKLKIYFEELSKSNTIDIPTYELIKNKLGEF